MSTYDDALVEIAACAQADEERQCIFCRQYISWWDGGARCTSDGTTWACTLCLNWGRLMLRIGGR